MKLASSPLRSAVILLELLLVHWANTTSHAGPVSAQDPPLVQEPNYTVASEWWTDLWNIWTPVGWKDHLYRFNVLWNGTILAKPDMNRRSRGQGLQLSLTPDYDQWVRDFNLDKLKMDEHSVRQGWNNDQAPVLWSEWSKNGWRIRSEVFAHVRGGTDLRIGNEPLFLWLRLGVSALNQSPGTQATQGFDLLLQSPHLSPSMTMWNNVRFALGQARYPHRLSAELGNLDSAKGLRILEDNARVRLAVAPHSKSEGLAFSVATDDQPWDRLHLRLPVKQGAHVDILLPMISEEREILDAELALGYDQALSETRRYWQKITACSTRIEIPESDINDCVRQSIRFSNLLTEKNPATGKYCKVNGSWAYADLWATPGSMDLVMLLDTLGYHRTAERYLSIFLDEQGTVKPPGPAYELHHGYFSTPALYKSIDWLSDNGAVLYTIAMHGLLTGERDFIARSLPGILGSCEWIAESRRKTNQTGYKGVLPPAIATDNRRVIQGVWSIGWNYKGLCAAVRLLQQLKHSRATEFALEAEAYRADFITALRDKCSKAPVWRDLQGHSHPLVPTTLAGEEEAETKHAFYLDTGPLFLVFAGLLDARDPLMQDTCAYFRAGPNRPAYRPDTDCWQAPVLDHELSSCEPCYSWNVFHSWQLGDRERFLEGMYSLFAGALSRQTRISCETRGGITGNVFASSLAIYLARLAVIDDQLSADELHLLRLMPLAWLAPGKRAIFRQVPTEQGPITVETQLSSDGRRLEVGYRAQLRNKVSRVCLHIPPIPGLKVVKVNGAKVWAGGPNIVTLETGAKQP